MQISSSFAHPKFGVRDALLMLGVSELDDFESSFKRSSKTLLRALEPAHSKLKLSQVQEALARSIGFSNVHALQQALSKVHDGLDKLDYFARSNWLQTHEPQLASLSALYQLRAVTRVSGTGAVKFDYLSELSRLVSKHLPVDDVAITEAMCRAWTGATCSLHLRSLTVGLAGLAGPLTGFTVGECLSGKPYGCFYLTEAGRSVVDHILYDMPEPTQSTVQENQQTLDQLLALTTQFPDLYHAWAQASLVARHLFYSGDYSQLQRAELMIATAVKTAKNLIPKGFKGEISWGELDNREYLTALYELVSLKLHTGAGLSQAYTVASEILRVCPSDNGGVRVMMPVLAAMRAKSMKTVDTAIKNALKDGGPSGLLNAGLAQLWLGEAAGVQPFIEAVLRFPAFAAMLDSEHPTRSVESALALRVPMSYENPYEEVSAAMHLLADEDFAATVRTILRDPALVAVELRLAKLLKSGDRLDWLDQVEPASQLLAKKLSRQLTLVNYRAFAG